MTSRYGYGSSRRELRRLNGKRLRGAVKLTDGKSAYCLATLAAAFAETGRFDLAVKWQTRALEAPQYEREEGPSARQRLQLFESRKPYREE